MSDEELDRLAPWNEEVKAEIERRASDSINNQSYVNCQGAPAAGMWPGILYPCLDQAVQYFQEHYNQPLSIKEYAAAHNLSEGWFIQNFKQYTNSTPAQYLLSLRIHNAKVLLESTNYNVTEISNIIGYENPLYFSRIFKKQTGFSPSEYRKKIFSEDNSTHSVSIISPD